MPEKYILRGRKCRVETIQEEGNRKVKAIYPESRAYGKLFYWEWVICRGDDIEVVAEAWPAKNGGGWWLKIKELNPNV